MPKISLAMIVGNEAAHIERCLRSFSGSYHELCLVRAIGSQVADETLQIAERVAGELGVEFRSGVYENRGEAREWPHVDNFAEARNQAFELATGDWIFWADADDTLRGDPADIVRACGMAVDDVLLFTYDVPGTNKAPWRERCIRRGLFERGRRWRFAVHENLVSEADDRKAQVASPVWVHSPLAIKPRSHDRNLRILSNALREGGSQLFYVHQEHYYANSKAKAVEFGKLALGWPNLHESFRLEILMNLGRLAATPKESLEWFGRAMVEMPQLREPLAGAVLASLEGGEPVRALEFARRMDSIPLPPESRRPWCFEAKWYGWHGLDLLERCQRLNGVPVPAVESPKISLLHATRGRAQKAWECRERWMSLAANPERIEYIMAIDADDQASGELARQFRHVVVEPGSCVRAWNAAAVASTGEILVQLSDDWTPPLGWDRQILEAFAGVDGPAVLAVGDGARTDGLLCMAILNRARLEEQRGELFFAGYESVFSDNEFSHRAWRDGVVIDRRADLVFTHAHPAFGKGEWDKTYADSNAPERYARGAALFKERNPDAETARAG